MDSTAVTPKTQDPAHQSTTPKGTACAVPEGSTSGRLHSLSGVTGATKGHTMQTEDITSADDAQAAGTGVHRAWARGIVRADNTCLRCLRTDCAATRVLETPGTVSPFVC